MLGILSNAVYELYSNRQWSPVNEKRNHLAQMLNLIISTTYVRNITKWIASI